MSIVGILRSHMSTWELWWNLKKFLFVKYQQNIKISSKFTCESFKLLTRVKTFIHDPPDQSQLRDEQNNNILGLPDVVFVSRNISKMFTHAASNIVLFYFPLCQAESFALGAGKKHTKNKINKFLCAGDILKLEKNFFSLKAKNEKTKQVASRCDLSPKELKYCRVVSDFTLLSEVISVFWNCWKESKKLRQC